MSTTYDATPSLLDRVVGADLILLGTAHGPVRVDRLDGEERPRVYGWFEVRPERVLDGEPRSEPILLRVIGEGTDADATWLVPVADERPMVALLNRDVGPGLPDNTFAPCFTGVYELAADGEMRVPEEALDRATRELAGAARGRLTVEHLSRLIEAVGRRRAEDRRRLDEEEPAEVRDRPRPDVQELPRSPRDVVDPSPGGGQDAQLD